MRHFTRTQLKEIQDYLATEAIKDSELPEANKLQEGDMIAVIQNGVNKKATLNKLVGNIQGKIVVDSTLSSTSENPVQNKVITEELGKKLERRDMLDHINFSDSEEVEDVNLDYYTKADADDRFVQKEYGKVLSSNDFTDKDKEKLKKLPETAISDVPMGGKLYGRANGEWVPVGLWSSLKVNLTIEGDANPEDYTLVISYLNVERRIPYKQGLVVSDIPAGLRVRVSMIPPKNFTAPRTLIYDSYLSVTQEFNGMSKYITNGVYILDKDGGYTEWMSWEPKDNANAVGVGYMSSDLAFVVAKVYGDATNDRGSETFVTNALWGSYEFDCSSIGMVQASNKDDALLITQEDAKRNNEIMVESHKQLQPNWINEPIINETSRGYFPAAMVAHKYKSAMDDTYGNWRLPSFREFISTVGSDAKKAMVLIGGTVLTDLGSRRGWSCIPRSDNQGAYNSKNDTWSSQRRDSYTALGGSTTGVIMVRDFFSV